MLRSLVGSEMCIRDSTCGALHHHTVAFTGRSSGDHRPTACSPAALAPGRRGVPQMKRSVGQVAELRQRWHRRHRSMYKRCKRSRHSKSIVRSRSHPRIGRAKKQLQQGNRAAGRRSGCTQRVRGARSVYPPRARARAACCTPRSAQDANVECARVNGCLLTANPFVNIGYLAKYPMFIALCITSVMQQWQWCERIVN